MLFWLTIGQANIQATHSPTNEVTGYKTKIITPIKGYLDMKLDEIGTTMLSYSVRCPKTKLRP